LNFGFILRRIFKRRKDKTGLPFILYSMDSSARLALQMTMRLRSFFCKARLVRKFDESEMKKVGIAANLPKRPLKKNT
jgi:hypothetical protein